MTTEPQKKLLYLNDITPGQVFHSGEHPLDAEQIIAFASQFDPQPFHTDAVAARDTFFEGLAASGWHTMAITMKLVVKSVPLAKGIIGAGGEVAWPRPTRPGDILRVKSEILAIKPSRSRPDRAIVSMQHHTFNQRDEVLQEFVAKLVAFDSRALMA